MSSRPDVGVVRAADGHPDRVVDQPRLRPRRSAAGRRRSAVPPHRRSSIPPVAAVRLRTRQMEDRAAPGRRIARRSSEPRTARRACSRSRSIMIAWRSEPPSIVDVGPERVGAGVALARVREVHRHVGVRRADDVVRDPVRGRAEVGMQERPAGVRSPASNVGLRRCTGSADTSRCHDVVRPGRPRTSFPARSWRPPGARNHQGDTSTRTSRQRDRAAATHPSRHRLR